MQVEKKSRFARLRQMVQSPPTNVPTTTTTTTPPTLPAETTKSDPAEPPRSKPKAESTPSVPDTPRPAVADDTVAQLSRDLNRIELNKSTFSLRAVAKPDPHPFTLPSHISKERLLRLLPSRELIFLDTETTGIAKRDRVIEIALVYRNYETMEQRTFYSLVNPINQRSSRAAYAAHKIPDAALASQPTMCDLAPSLLSFIADATIPLVAHNAAFDRRMINYELSGLSLPELDKERFVCTYEMARRMNGTGKGINTLSALCENYTIDTSSRSECHGAMQDTLLLAELYPFLLIDAP